MTNWLSETRDFWALVGNYRRAGEMEGFPPSRSWPWAFCCPVGALTTEGNPIPLHKYSRQITVGCELAFVVDRDARDLNETDAESYIREFRVMAAFNNPFHMDWLLEPSQQETAVWTRCMSRWGDSLNCLSNARVTPADAASLEQTNMRIAIDGISEVITNTADYVHRAGGVLAFLSHDIGLLAGDVITLGRAGDVLTIPVDMALPEGITVVAEIEGIGELRTSILDQRERREVRPGWKWWLF